MRDEGDVPVERRLGPRPDTVTPTMHFNLQREVTALRREFQHMSGRLSEGAMWMQDVSRNMSELRSAITDWLSAFAKDHDMLTQALDNLSKAVARIKGDKHQWLIVGCCVIMFFIIDILVRLAQISAILK